MDREGKELVDKGFDSDFSPELMDRICEFFGSEHELQEFIFGVHEEKNALDMKRGEFYPEILRAIISMKRAVAKAYNVDLRQVHPNFGSNGSIDTVMTAMKLREVNRKVNATQEGGMLVATPTYFRNYNSCLSKQMRMIKVPFIEPNWTYDLAGMLGVLKKKRPTVVFLVTPNNPTGTAIPDEDILSILDAVPSNTLVVMDRTLVNIMPEVKTEDLISRFCDKQLAILHSFSKYVGMSHLRVGFALYSNIDLAEEIRPMLPLGLGVEGALKATRHILRHGPLSPSDSIVRNIRDSKAMLQEFCRESEFFDCSDFVGNYCLVTLHSGLTSHMVESTLRNAGIYVMGGHDFPEPRIDVIRLHTGGKPEYMEKTVHVLAGIKP